MKNNKEVKISATKMDSRERETLKLDKSATSSIDAYHEYHLIVGDDDGGKPFSEKQYEAYKKRVLPMRLKNRLYVSWTGPRGLDCKLIGPETPCFCQHRYKQHRTDFAEFPKSNKEVVCEVRGCRCSGFEYVPKNGTQHLRCSQCKHETVDHSVAGVHKCTRCAPGKCSGFKSSYRCTCGDLARDHVTMIESREQRLDRGHPVARVEPPYKAMGGVTGMSSLLEGYMRLDESGIGAPSQDWFQQNPGTSLRASEVPPKILGTGVRYGIDPRRKMTPMNPAAIQKKK